MSYRGAHCRVRSGANRRVGRGPTQRALAAGAAAAAAVGLMVAGGAGLAAALSAQTSLFSSSSAGYHADAATVPADVCFVQVTANGGDGGAAGSAAGGAGASISTTVPVNAGDNLDVSVAGDGASFTSTANGGFGGGGGGFPLIQGGGGGGASVVSDATSGALLVVSGGGGGGSIITAGTFDGGAGGLPSQSSLTAAGGNGGGGGAGIFGFGGTASGDGGGAGTDSGGGGGVGAGGAGGGDDTAASGGGGGGTVGGGGGGASYDNAGLPGTAGTTGTGTAGTGADGGGNGGAGDADGGNGGVSTNEAGGGGGGGLGFGGGGGGYSAGGGAGYGGGGGGYDGGGGGSSDVIATATATTSTAATTSGATEAGSVSISYDSADDCTAPVFTADSSPATATVGTAYSYTFVATGNPTPTYSLSSGTLPTGLTLSSAGVLSGTPTASGPFSFEVTASNGVSPNAVSPSLSITVAPADTAPVFTSASSTTFTVGTSGSFDVTASGNPAPSITLTTGTLPTGVSFSAGVLSGTPAAGTGGVYDLVFTASNGVSPAATQDFTLTVEPAPTITVLNSSANPSLAFQPVTYTATVSPVPDGGTVSFSDGGKTIASCAAASVNTTSGKATCSVTYTKPATHDIIATYSGDSSYATSTSSTLVQVVKPNTAVTLTSTPNPSKIGQTVTYTATVSTLPPGGAIGGGTVRFEDLTMAGYDGGDYIAGCQAVPLNPTTHTATCTAAYTSTGKHPIVAYYSGYTAGGAELSASQSARYSQTVGSPCSMAACQGED